MQENELWSIAKEQLRQNIAKEIFSDWFESLQFVSINDDEIVLGAQGEFAAMWVSDNYIDIITRHLSLAAGMNVGVKIVSVDEDDEELERKRRAQAERKNSYAQMPKAFAPPPAIDSRNTFENFVVGESNQFAYEAAFTAAKEPGRAFNPLLLYGATGTGKTHLMHSIAHFIFKDNPRAHIVYLSSERFVNEFIAALSGNEIFKFRQRYRNVDVLLIDDIQFFSGKDGCQNEFFHTFNDLYNAQKQIVLSCDKPVNEVPKLEPRLVSRFEWGTSWDIQPPNYETRYAILSRKAAALGASIDHAVLDLIAHRITKNVRRLEGALNKVVGYMSMGKSVDLESAQKLLADTFMHEDDNSQIGIELIQGKVAELYKVDVAEMTGRRRTASIAQARQIAMYVSRKLTNHSLEEIGRRFGGRDHGTVMHAIKTVTGAMESDANLRRSIDYLLKILSF